MNENMNGSQFCTRCGAANAMGVNFCVSCGQKLVNGDVATPDAAVTPNVTETVPPVMPVGGNPEPVMNNMPNNNMVNQNVVQTNTVKFNFFTYMLGAFLKPFDKFKSEEENLGNFKNVGLLALIITGALTILNLIQTMISTVRVTSFWSDEVEWVWENLKEIEYIKVIGLAFLTYVGVLFAITGVYYLAALVVKKDVKFPKLLGATVTAFIPAAVAMSILSPILSLIYSPLGMGVTVVGCIYAVVIFLELVNDLIAIENKNTRIYFHLTCLSILVIGGAVLAYNLILGSFTSDLGSDLGSLMGDFY